MAQDNSFLKLTLAYYLTMSMATSVSNSSISNGCTAQSAHDTFLEIVEKHVCSLCLALSQTKLRTCLYCLQAGHRRYYCDEACQTADWDTHIMFCEGNQYFNSKQKRRLERMQAGVQHMHLTQLGDVVVTHTPWHSCRGDATNSKVYHKDSPK